ncbi:probable E3 ubiquitin-protein ligase TRIML1 [Gracilinanus agilis]|uniref:probable E3 ubiquitin-protein ligase TRIML1 n=1 Tax=Gracilinanus agilis TaxID=191870 RepID=UPI001CFF1698|nr:probable E3 ubiquitin-protein ligase TRIML1 [Gracilinanus agilis]
MDVSEVAEKLRSELTCSVCLDLFAQAVTLDCGHSFCRECVLQSWQQAHVSWTCPLCKSSSQPRALKANQLLKDLVSFIRLRSPGLGEEGGQAICGQHQAIQNLFCEDDHTPLCVSCLTSLEHEAHRVYPIEESAETCKGQLQEALGLVWAKVREVHMLLKQEKRKWQRCQIEAHMLKQVILPEYINTHLDWTEAEQQNLLEGEKRINVRRLETTQARIFCYVQSLKKMTEELEKTLEQPVMEMLLEWRSSMERSQELLLHCPEPAALGWTVCGTTGMRDLLLAFQSHISMDPETAHSNLIFSGDLKSVSIASNCQDLLANLQGGEEDLLCVLGAQSFTSGSHYWEVEVGSETEWEVGICMELGNVQGNIYGDVLSLQYFNMGDQFKLFIFHTLENPEETGPLHRLGIFLHYEEGHLSFYNVTQGCLIYAFSPFTFQGPVRPFFSLGLLQEENQTNTLTICPLIPQ